MERFQNRVIVAIFAVGIVSAVIAIAGVIAPALASGGVGPLPACVTEDSDNCVWDATQRGNGIGRSFVTIDGVTYYAESGR